MAPSCSMVRSEQVQFSSVQFRLENVNYGYVDMGVRVGGGSADNPTNFSPAALFALAPLLSRSRRQDILKNRTNGVSKTKFINKNGVTTTQSDERTG